MPTASDDEHNAQTVPNIYQQLDDHDCRLDHDDSRINNLIGAVDDINSRLDDINRRANVNIEHFIKRLHNVEQRAASVDNVVANYVHDQLHDLHGRIDEHHKRLADIERGAAAATGTEAATTTADILDELHTWLAERGWHINYANDDRGIGYGLGIARNR